MTTTDPRVARHIIRDWERIEEHDRDVGFLVLFDEQRDTDQPDVPSADDRAIARHALVACSGSGFPVRVQAHSAADVQVVDARSPDTID